MSTLSVAGRARIAAAPLSAEARTRHGDAPAAATVQRLADLLDSPVRITVSGPRGCGTTTLAEALRSAFRLRPGGTPARTSFSESPAVAPLVAGDAPIVLLSPPEPVRSRRRIRSAGSRP